MEEFQKDLTEDLADLERKKGKKVFCKICEKQVPIENTDIAYIGGFYYCISHIRGIKNGKYIRL